MPLPLIPLAYAALAGGLAATGVGVYNETAHRDAMARSKAEGKLNFRDIRQTENGYTTTNRSAFLPENISWKRPWESNNAYADDVISKYNARNSVPLSSEQISQFRKEIESGSRPHDALRNAVRQVADVRQDAWTQAKFNANQEKAKIEYQGQQQRKQALYESEIRKEEALLQGEIAAKDLEKRLAAQEASDMLQAITRPTQVYRFF